MTTQSEAAASGLYWFIEWEEPNITLFNTLAEAQRAAFEECLRVMDTHEKDGKPSGIEIVVFKGRDAESSVRIYAHSQQGGYAWSPPEYPAGVTTLSPEECAHLIQRRIRARFPGGF